MAIKRKEKKRKKRKRETNYNFLHFEWLSLRYKNKNIAFAHCFTKIILVLYWQFSHRSATFQDAMPLTKAITSVCDWTNLSFFLFIWQRKPRRQIYYNIFCTNLPSPRSTRSDPMDSAFSPAECHPSPCNQSINQPFTIKGKGLRSWD